MATPAPPVVLPAQTTQTAVIFLHHSGANGLSWAKRFESMRLPHVKYIFPNAPVRPLTLYDGLQQTAWFDVHGFSVNSPVDEKGIAEANSTLQRMIKENIESGTPSDRILLVGYSLGGCLALYSALTCDKTLAGTFVMNCWLADYRWSVGEKFTEASRNTPIVQVHGDNDPFVPLKYANISRDIGKAGGANYTLKIQKSSSHWPTPEMFEEMKKFIACRLPAINGDTDAQNRA